MAETADRAAALPFPFFVPYGRYLVFLLNMLAAGDRKGRIVSNHTHPYYECIIVKSGRVHYRIGRERHTASRATAVIIPPHTAHVREAKSACTLYAFHLMIKDTNADSVAVRPCIPAASLLTACEDVMAEIDGQKAQWPIVARHTLIAALVRLCRDAMIAPGSQPRRTNVDAAFISAIRYINDNIRTEIAVPSVARASGVSERHLSRLFRANIGASPQNYILEKKLFLAYSDLIAGKNETVRSIAHALAFYDAGYFARIVKEKFGLTPTEIQALDH